MSQLRSRLSKLADVDGKPVRRLGKSRTALKFFRYIDAVILVAFIAFVVSRRDYGFRFWIGMTTTAFGIFFWVLAHVQLGDSFSITPQARRLVTTGLYSKFRHPVYLFGGIAYVGLIIALGNWIVLLLFLAYYSFQIPRMKKEEAALEAAFGDQYRRYKSTTWL